MTYFKISHSKRSNGLFYPNKKSSEIDKDVTFNSQNFLTSISGQKVLCYLTFLSMSYMAFLISIGTISNPHFAIKLLVLFKNCEKHMIVCVFVNKLIVERNVNIWCCTSYQMCIWDEIVFLSWVLELWHLIIVINKEWSKW